MPNPAKRYGSSLLALTTLRPPDSARGRAWFTLT
jgi:hypothetical protein